MSVDAYRDPPANAGPSLVRRAPARAAYDLVWAAVRLAVAFIPVFLAPSWLTWIVTIVLVLGVVFLLVAAFMLSFVATCPGCGGSVGGISTWHDCVGHQCNHCKRFVEVADGQLVLTPEDRVDSPPAFNVVLGGPVSEFPELCCACGAPATRKRTIANTKTKTSLELPHCDTHDAGARLLTVESRTLLVTGSLRFARALAERDKLDVIGTNHRSEPPTRVPWGFLAAALLLVAFGIGLSELVQWAERSGSPIMGNAVMVLIYAILGRAVLVGIFIAMGAVALMAFVAGAGHRLRRRIWPD